MADKYKGIPETSASTEAQMEAESKISSSLIHPSFPSMGVVKPSHLGSQSETPKGEGDYEQHMPLEFMPGSVSSKMSKL